MPDDPVALATFAVAFVTLLLALATVYLAVEAGRARKASQAADRARQREVHLLALRPLLISEPSIADRSDGQPYAKVPIVTSADLPVLNLNVTIRGRGEDGNDVSRSTDRGSLPGATAEVATVELDPFLHPSANSTWGAGLEVVITYHGLLGQWVVEHYEWNLTARRTQTRAKTWRLYRLEIAPRGVPGAASLDLSFGDVPLYS